MICKTRHQIYETKDPQENGKGRYDSNGANVAVKDRNNEGCIAKNHKPVDLNQRNLNECMSKLTQGAILIKVVWYSRREGEDDIRYETLRAAIHHRKREAYLK